MAKEIKTVVSDAEYERLSDGKGGRTWKEVLADGCGVEL